MSWLRQGPTSPGVSPHLGDALAGLVDGHLDHHARERALAHLTHCDCCRVEVESLRQLRARLLELGTVSVAIPAGLSERLVSMAQPAAPPQQPPSASVAGDPNRRRRGSAPRRRPAGRTVLSGDRRVPKVAAAGAVLALGLGGVLAIGSSSHRPVRPSVQPTDGVRLVDTPDTDSRFEDFVSVRPAVLVGP